LKKLGVKGPRHGNDGGRMKPLGRNGCLCGDGSLFCSGGLFHSGSLFCCGCLYLVARYRALGVSIELARCKVLGV
jgi:hypothetical protein